MIDKAIIKINPDAKFTYQNEDIDTIKWLDGTTPIDKSEIEAKLEEVKAEYDAEEWKRNRQAEYPSHEDCIHALLDGGDTLTELQEKRQQIKAKYPKS